MKLRDIEWLWDLPNTIQLIGEQNPGFLSQSPKFFLLPCLYFIVSSCQSMYVRTLKDSSWFSYFITFFLSRSNKILFTRNRNTTLVPYRLLLLFEKKMLVTGCFYKSCLKLYFIIQLTIVCSPSQIILL